MPIFTYKAKDRSGGIVAGTLEAESRAAVTSRLQATGLFPVDIRDEATSGGTVSARLKSTRGKRIRSVDLTNFYQQMSDLIGAGVPLVKALNIVKNQTTNPTMAAILQQVSADVQEGATFAKALERHTKVFTPLTTALVRAGETGGLLDQTLRRIAEYAENEDELRSKLKSAMAYPVIMIFLGAAALFVLLTYVLPKVMIVFADFNQELPAITQFVQNVSFAMANYWHVIMISLVVAFVVGRRWVRTESGGFQYHLMLLKVPTLGQLLLKRQIAAFTRTLGSLLRNGVPILSAIDISAQVLTLRPIREDVKRIPESITQGSGIAPALRESTLFPSVVVNMVAIGEETGQLPDVLLRVAQSYETQVERDVKTLTSMLEPIIIIVLGLIVGFVVISMLLPIFSLDPSQGM